MSTSVRRATPADADALVELRIQMFESMGEPVPPDGEWSSRAVNWFHTHLGDGTAAAFVAEVPDGGLVAAALGKVDRHTPSPSNPSGLSGFVSNVVTRASHRKRGHARACLEHLLAWFRDEAGVAAVDLFATGDGERLYEELGFRVRPYPAMRLTLDSAPSGDDDS